MARIYAALIRKGIKTLEDVPARLTQTTLFQFEQTKRRAI